MDEVNIHWDSASEKNYPFTLDPEDNFQVGSDLTLTGVLMQND